MASSGTALAARDLITGHDVKNGSLTGADVKNGSLTGSDVKKGSIKLSDLSDGVQQMLATGTPGHNGAKGEQGVAGPAGSAGATGPAGPAGPALPEDFSYTNASVTQTQAGVKFGPYGDGGAEGGSLRYDGLDGMKLSEITSLVYRAKYATDDDAEVGVPYLRVFVNDDNGDVIFSPNTQPAKDTAEDVFHSWDVTAGTVRYGDDAGDAPDSAWADVVAAHGDDVISGIYVSTGFSAGKNLRAFLSDLSVNAKTFHFGS